MTEISITRALATLKLMDKKIDNATTGGVFLAISVGHGKDQKTNFTNQTPEQVTNTIKASFDKVNALLQNRTALKKAIVLSNANTLVDIGRITMTVAEAIEYKSFLEKKRTFLRVLNHQFTNVQNAIDTNNAKLENDINALLTTVYGAEKSKITEDLYVQVATPQKNKKECGMIDPCNIRDKINSMTAELDSLESEIDHILSESNARTTVCVELSGME